MWYFIDLSFLIFAQTIGIKCGLAMFLHAAHLHKKINNIIPLTKWPNNFFSSFPWEGNNSVEYKCIGMTVKHTFQSHTAEVRRFLDESVKKSALTMIWFQQLPSSYKLTRWKTNKTLVLFGQEFCCRVTYHKNVRVQLAQQICEVSSLCSPAQ